MHSNTNKHIIIVAGEASGDMHAAHLVQSIKKINPSITFSGLGGEKMKNNGVTIYKDMTQLGIVGFIEVIKHYGELKKTFDLIFDKALKSHPDAVILVDYPGFNLRLAKKLKEIKIKVIYYISPQIWAWKKNRVHFIKKYVDKMLVLFNFEKDFYSKYKVNSSFVGHPLLDQVVITSSKKEILTALNLQEYKFTIGLLPGSRNNEVKKLLPVMLKTVQTLIKKYPSLQFLILKAPTIEKSLIHKYLDEIIPENKLGKIPNPSHSKKKDAPPISNKIKTYFPVSILDNKTYDGINACDLCIVASGTATLETAILQKPMVVIYKTSFLTWLLAKLFVRIPNIGLVNVVAGKKIVPECIQFQATPKKISNELIKIFTNELTMTNMRSNLHMVKKLLTTSSAASQKAAQEVIEAL